MKFKFTIEEKQDLVDILDIALKATGIRNLNIIMHLLSTIGQEGEIVELNENDLNALREVFDVALRQMGLPLSNMIMNLTNILSDPIIENENS